MKNTNKQKKEEIVKQLLEKADKAKGLIFASYHGMTHKQMEELRRNLRSVDAELVVAKNTLFKLSLKQTKNSILHYAQDKTQNPESDLKGPTVALFAYNDVILGVKELVKKIKQLTTLSASTANKKLPSIKFGIFEGKRLEEKDVLRLSTLPSREVLIAQVVGGMKTPIYALHHALSWNLQKLVMTLKAIEQSKLKVQS